VVSKSAKVSIPTLRALLNDTCLVAGHLVAQQAPEEMVAALTEFLAPYRDGSAAAQEPRAHAAASCG
jgi:hypothetical protein